MATKGLSPRLRGNRPAGRAGAKDAGSIPALTGKPATSRLKAVCTEVYPRAYGETAVRLVLCVHVGGLSPRLRGNHESTENPRPPLGSIPALTGKPMGSSRWGGGCGVYPRAYGETRVRQAPGGGDAGLSPRLRGNRRGMAVRCASPRSIPALTGKPRRGRRTDALVRVYPRAYGETHW